MASSFQVGIGLLSFQSFSADAESELVMVRDRCDSDGGRQQVLALSLLGSKLDRFNICNLTRKDDGLIRRKQVSPSGLHRSPQGGILADSPCAGVSTQLETQLSVTSCCRELDNRRGIEQKESDIVRSFISSPKPSMGIKRIMP